MSYERIILVGNLEDAPEQRNANGQPVTSFSLAVNRKRSGQKTTTWYRCTAWGVVAEHAVMYLKKGSKVLVEGSGLRASAYLGKDGQPHTSLELTADRITFLDSVPLDGEGDEIPM
jgi:single-strand DNA-binding protein